MVHRKSVCVCMYLFNTGSMWHKVNFKKAGLNWDFSFSWTSCHNKASQASLPDYLSIVEDEEMDWCFS